MSLLSKEAKPPAPVAVAVSAAALVGGGVRLDGVGLGGVGLFCSSFNFLRFSSCFFFDNREVRAATSLDSSLFNVLYAGSPRGFFFYACARVKFLSLAASPFCGLGFKSGF